MNARLYVVSYDIPHDQRRVKVANTLKSYGERVQYSVFECWLTAREFSSLKERLARLVASSEDSVRFYPSSTNVTIMGVGVAPSNAELFII